MPTAPTRTRRRTAAQDEPPPAADPAPEPEPEPPAAGELDDDEQALYPPNFVRDQVDGVKVVKDEVLSSGLSAHMGRLVPLKGYRVLTLENGEQVYGCNDCPDFTGTRGEVKAHRGAEHEVALGGSSRRRKDPAADGEVVTLPPGSDTMTLRELLELAGHVAHWETVLANLASENEDLRATLAAEKAARRTAERDLDKLQQKLRRLVGED